MISIDHTTASVGLNLMDIVKEIRCVGGAW